MVEREETESLFPHAQDTHQTLVGNPQQSGQREEPLGGQVPWGSRRGGAVKKSSLPVFWSPLCALESLPSTCIAHVGPAGTGKKEEKELCWLGVCSLGVEEWETARCSTIHSAWGSLLGHQAQSSVLGSLMHSGGPLSWAEPRPYLLPQSRVFSGGMVLNQDPTPHLNPAST